MGYVLAGAAALLGAATGAASARYILISSLKRMQVALQHEQEKRAADRQGRIKAEKALKELRLQLALHRQPKSDSSVEQQLAVQGNSIGQPAASTNSSDSTSVRAPTTFPFTAIGTLRSCFSSRTGTPRQPHLVPAARAALQLGPGIPTSCLDGLQAYSHCWVLYVFHENTDLAKLLAARNHSSGEPLDASRPVHTSGLKSHVRVPRLNGAKMGVLATRSPHRPVPIGLSTAQIIQVDTAAGILVLGGADIIDGSPVLDIKPYVPFCDSLPHASAPDWVRVAADEEPLALGTVVISPAAAQSLSAAWHKVRRKSLYSTEEDFIALCYQVLARDIRSLHQRTNILPVQSTAAVQHQPGKIDTKQAEATSSSARPGEHQGRYVVALDGVLVYYDVCPRSGQIYVRTAEAQSPSALDNGLHKGSQ